MGQRLARRSRLPFHERVDLGNRILFTNTCDVEIDHCGGQVSVAHVLLDHLETDTGFQEMSCVAVPKRMRTDTAVVPIELPKNSFDRPLNGRIAHGFLGFRSLRVVFALGGKIHFLLRWVL